VPFNVKVTHNHPFSKSKARFHGIACRPCLNAPQPAEDQIRAVSLSLSFFLSQGNGRVAGLSCT